MIAGQRLRLKPRSRLAREWEIPPGSEGTLICEYQIRARTFKSSDRLDVRFNQTLVIWGAPAVEFEPVEEAVRVKTNSSSS